MIWYPLLLALIAAACVFLTKQERRKPWFGSPRTTRTDQPFLWEYEMSASSRRRRRRPIASRIGISAAIPFLFAVEEEKWTHRLSKWFGFCEEFQTEDNEFDQRVFIISDDKMFQQKLRSNIDMHQLIVKAFMHGARQIYSTPEHLIIRLKKTQENPPEEADALVEILSTMKRLLSGSNPVEEGGANTHPSRLRLFKAFIVFLFASAFLTLVLSLVMGYKIVEWEPMLPMLVNTSALAIAAILLAIRVLFRNSSHGHEVLMKFLAIGTWGVVLASGAGIWFVNCHYDRATAQVYVQPVIDKHVRHGRKSSRSYVVRTANWHAPGKVLSVQVSSGLYNRLNAGDTIQVYVQPGLFGLEWIARIGRLKNEGKYE